MLSTKLFDHVLLNPAKEGADRLFIVSGYATSAMAFHHIEALSRLPKSVDIRLIVGMCRADGLSQSNHRGFQELQTNSLSGQFSCRYLTQMPPVHSKAYIWYEGKNPACSFVGSANYTQRAFDVQQRELMVVSDPGKGLKYYKRLLQETIHCADPEAEEIVKIFGSQRVAKFKRESVADEKTPLPVSPVRHIEPGLADLPYVRISLLDRTGTTLPQRSGLNWGQRPEEGREPNQAYIRLPAKVYRTDFFPARTVHFTVLTDDDKILVCTRAQDNGKAIHTPHNNSSIGEYFRRRLQVPSGAPVRLTDLQRYGRSDIVFYKLDDESYFMDFSPPGNR